MTRRPVVMLSVTLLVLVLAPALHAGDAAALYTSKCAACHGADGKAGTAMGKKLAIRSFASPDVQKQSDADLLGVVTKGKQKMPAYGGKIADADLKALVQHIRGFTKK